MSKENGNEKEQKCVGCKHYSHDVQKSSLPVMHNKVFYKVTMKCHINEGNKVLNEKYENVVPSEKQIEKISPKACEKYKK